MAWGVFREVQEGTGRGLSARKPRPRVGEPADRRCVPAGGAGAHPTQGGTDKDILFWKEHCVFDFQQAEGGPRGLAKA